MKLGAYDPQKVAAEKIKRETTQIRPDASFSFGAGKKEAIVTKKSEDPKIVISQTVVDEIDRERIRLKKERNILSSQNAKLVEEARERFAKESPLLAEEFMRGNVPCPGLREHYAKMQSVLEQNVRLYDRLEHLKKEGEMPAEEPKADFDNATKILVLEAERQKLAEMIHKTNKKLSGGLKPKNPERVVLWKEKIALAQAKRDDINAQLKRLRP